MFHTRSILPDKSPTYFQKIRPHASLQHLIKFYWVLKDESEEPPCPEWMLPDPYAELIFNLNKAPYQRMSQAGQAEQLGASYVVVSNGPPVKAARIETIDMVGVKLLPHALQHMAQTSLHDLTQPVPMAFLQQPRLKNLEERLSKAHSIMEIRQLLDHAMFQLLEGIETPLFFEAMNWQVKSGGILAVNELSQGLGIHISTLEKGFKKYCGISPKRFQRMVRFRSFYQSFLKSAGQGTYPHFHDFGYFDQNHLIKEFKFFTGSAPGKIFNSPHSFEVTNQHFGREYWAF